MDKLKKGLIGSILISVILAVTLTYVWATTPTTTFYISTGVYPGAPTYTIWTEGSGISQAYYAKRYEGFIPTYSGTTNATTLINSVISEVYTAGGGKIFLARGAYHLSGTSKTLINLNDKAQIELCGEGAAWPAGAPSGGGALLAGSTQTTLLIAPANYTGAVINATMSVGTTLGMISIRSLAVYGNISPATMKAGGGGYGIVMLNVRTVDCKISEVAAISFKYGFYIGGSSVEIDKCFSAYCFDGYFLPLNAEYVTLRTCHSYCDYNSGFDVVSSGINTLIDCLTMPSFADLHVLDAANPYYRIAPLGYQLQSYQGLQVIGCQHVGCGTGFYISGGGVYNNSIMLNGITVFGFTSTPTKYNQSAAVQIYGANYTRVILVNSQLMGYYNAVWIVKSAQDSYIYLDSNSLTCYTTVPLNQTLLEGTVQGNITIHDSVDY